MKKFSNYIPILEWLPRYQKANFPSDLIAGLTVGIMLVPQGMAYALLAGMPPIYGLYGALIPLFLYALFGTSRHLSIGPVAVSSLLVWAGISQIEGAIPLSERFIELTILTGLLVGVVQLLMGFLRLGFLVYFLSHPVLAGFTSAAAVIIGISQIKHLLGIHVPRFEQAYETVDFLLWNSNLTNPCTLIIAAISILVLVLFRRINKKLPGALIVVVLGILLSYWLDLPAAGVAIVGAVPEGLPAFSAPIFDLKSINLVMPTVLTVSIIGVVESISISKAIQAKNRDYQIRPNQELRAIGLSKIGGAFFQALPTSGSFSRSAVNNDAGGKTGISSIITMLLVGLTLLFFTPLFYYLPKASLAAIIFVAIVGLFEFKEAKKLWRIHRQDFSMMLTTFLLTLIFGIEVGVLVGAVLSIILVVYRTTKPHFAVLGNMPGTPAYRNVERFSTATEKEGILIIRMDASLYFGNSDFFKSRVRKLVAKRKKQLQMVLLDASSFHEIDSSGMLALTEIVEELQKANIEFYLTGAIGPVRDMLNQCGFNQLVEPKHQFMYIHNAVEAFSNEAKNLDEIWSGNAIQANQRQVSKVRQFFNKIRGRK